MNGSVHSGKVTTVDALSCGTVVSAGWDDTVRSGEGTASATAAALGGQPKCSGSGGDLCVIATKDELACFSAGAVTGTTSIAYTATAIAVNPAADCVVVGAENNKIYVYSVNGGALTQTGEVVGHAGAVHR